MPQKKPHRKSGQQPQKQISSVFANIPSELKAVARWVNWRIELRSGKQQRIPIAPKTGYMASCDDAQTWGTYSEALKRYKRSTVRGIGFQLGDSYTGVDLDDCRNRKTGAIESWAREIIDGLNSYTEVSPSGDGVHILAKGALPPRGRRKEQVEMYDADHFFTMTGAHLAGTPSTVKERQTALTALHAQIFGRNVTQSGESQASGPSTSSLSDAELIGRASNAENKGKFTRLWRGEFSAYDSQSEADLALCMILAFWTGRNAQRIDSLFRQSGLLRSKWDEQHSADGRTYGQLTIEKAIERTCEVWNPSVTAANGGNVGPGLVKQLADAISSHEKFAQDPGSRLYRYANGVFKPDGEEHVKRRVKALLENWNESRKWSAARANEVVEYIRVDSPHLLERPPLDTVNVANGLLTLNTGELKPHSYEFLSPIQLPVKYNPMATCPRWEKFVSDVFPEDAQDLAWELPGWLMVPDTSIQKVPLLVGQGANGKSTFLRACGAFLGTANVSAESLHRLESNRFAVAQLVGMLANICPDLPSKSLESSSIFKALTGGDRVIGEFKFRQAFAFTPYARLLFSANDLPRSNDASYAYFRRWLIVPFLRTFDPNEQIPREVLDAQLAAPSELSGLLNKALIALKALHARRGLLESKSIRKAGSEFVRLTDPIAVWLAESTVRQADRMIAKSVLLEAYNRTARREKRPPSTKTAFGLAVKRVMPGIEGAQRKLGGKICWVWVGLKLVEQT